MDSDGIMHLGTLMLPKISELFELLWEWNDNPATLFNNLLHFSILIALIIKKILVNDQREQGKKPQSIQNLQQIFLPVFWLLRLSFWMSGPYFYAVYASKIVQGKPASIALISQIFLVGYAVIGMIGPIAGRCLDRYGRKKGTIAAATIYMLGSLSTKSSSVVILLTGRALGGVGSVLLSSAPEAWLIGEIRKTNDDPDGYWLRQTFGTAYSYDSVVAIAAGQIASFAANCRGPAGPFETSPLFLVLGAVVVMMFWEEDVSYKKKPHAVKKIIDEQEKQPVEQEMDGKKENVAQRATKDDKEEQEEEESKPTIRDGLKKVLEDEKILTIGVVQSFFEASMYIFVMQWPPAMNAAIQNYYGTGTSPPYGTIFSCFMACCMIGSATFVWLGSQNVPTEKTMIGMLSVATLSLLGSAIAMANETPNFIWLTIFFLCFEVCAGMYFPAIGTLRSKFLPCSHRSVIMTLFCVPLNIMVVSVVYFIHKIGIFGTLLVSSVLMLIATIVMIRLRYSHARELKQQAKLKWGSLIMSMRAALAISRNVRSKRKDNDSDNLQEPDKRDSYQGSWKVFLPGS